MKIGIASRVSPDLLNASDQIKGITGVAGFPLISHIVNGLVSKGHAVSIYTLSDQVKAPTTIKDKHITLCLGRSHKRGYRNFFSRERKDLVELMRENPVDIMNAQWSYEYAWAALDSGIPSVITIRDHPWTIFKYYKDPFRFIRLLMGMYVHKRSKNLIANSQYLKNLFPKNIQNKIEVISNFYQPFLEGYYDSQNQKEDYIITVANGFSERKNIKSGLQAFQMVRKRHPQLKYLILGAAMDKGEVAHKYSLENGLEKNVEFLGFKPFDEVISYIAKAKILLHPSREESFGNTMLEALVVGTCVVAGKDSGNVPFLLQHGRFGELCDVSAPEDMANTISELLDNPIRQQNLIEQGHDYAKKNYAKEAFFNKLIGYYTSILEKETV